MYFFIEPNAAIALNDVIMSHIVLQLSNSLDPGETASYSASRPDPSSLHMAL